MAEIRAVADDAVDRGRRVGALALAKDGEFAADIAVRRAIRRREQFARRLPGPNWPANRLVVVA